MRPAPEPDRPPRPAGPTRPGPGAGPFRGLGLPLPAHARPASARLLLLGLRVWALERSASAPPRPAVARALGPAAGPLSTLLEALSAALAEPFLAFPCGALAVSPDEALVLDLVAAAGRGDGAAARAITAELLPEATAARLFALAGRVALLLPGDGPGT